MDPEKIRILIVDDHPLFRDGLHGLLDSVPETEVIGEATKSFSSLPARSRTTARSGNTCSRSLMLIS